MTFSELWSTHPDDLAALDSRQLRERFVVSNLFRGGPLAWAYSHDDRLLIGGARLGGDEMAVSAPEALRAENLLDRREAAFVGLSGEVAIASSAGEFVVRHHDVLYLPLGTTDVRLNGHGDVYVVSAPAHAAGDAAFAGRDEVEAVRLGSAEGANDRTIRKYVHAGGIRSNQLVLGITTLEPGSVWNTMPAHTHARRTEVYLYDGLGDAPLIHLMGRPDDTRHLVLHDRDAVVSPPWSIHSGAATAAYSFIWAMAGENIDYGDVVSVAPGALR